MAAAADASGSVNLSGVSAAGSVAFVWVANQDGLRALTFKNQPVRKPRPCAMLEF